MDETLWHNLTFHWLYPWATHKHHPHLGSKLILFVSTLDNTNRWLQTEFGHACFAVSVQYCSRYGSRAPPQSTRRDFPLPGIISTLPETSPQQGKNDTSSNFNCGKQEVIPNLIVSGVFYLSQLPKNFMAECSVKVWAHAGVNVTHVGCAVIRPKRAR